MKKLLIPLAIATIAILPTGCTMQNETNNNITKTLSSSLSQLAESAKKITDLDENKLIINELNSQTNINKDYETANKSTNNVYNSNRIAQNYIKNRNYRRMYRQNNFPNSNKVNMSANSTKNNQNNYKLINNTYKNVNGADNYNYQPITSSTSNYTTDTATPTNRYYTSTYSPRYTDNVISSSTAITNYLEKIQDLYTICNDTCLASYDLDGLKGALIESCNNCNNLLNEVNSGKKLLSNEEIETLTAYNSTLQGCINDLNSCKDCSEEVNIINSMKGNFSSNCDTLVAKYLKVLNNLDANYSFCNNAQCTVTEINNYISKLTGKESPKTYNSRYKNLQTLEYYRDYTSQNNLNNNNYNQKQQNNTNNQNSDRSNEQSKNATTQNNTSNITEQNNDSAENNTNIKNNVNSNTSKTQTNTNNNLYNSGSHKTKDIKPQDVTRNDNLGQTQTSRTYPYRPATRNNANNLTNNTTTTKTTANNSTTQENINASTPSPKASYYSQTANNGVYNKTLEYKTNQQIQTPKAFGNYTLVGPQNVRASMPKTLELI